MASRDNPYLARAAVNWAWAQMFGRGIVEPVDDLGDHNPPSHPQLFQELTQYFVETGFDIRNLFRTLAHTQAYQRTSRVEREEDVPPEIFARMLLKVLSPEQLYDSLAEMRVRDVPDNLPGGAISGRLFDPGRQAFIAKMQATTRNLTEYQAGLPQALLLMNGEAVTDVTDIEKSRLLVSLEAPFLNDEERLETLYLSALARFPTDDEKEQHLSFLSAAQGEQARREAMGDLLWVLVNSAEFAFNH
jgi:hypothetical protein